MTLFMVLIALIALASPEPRAPSPGRAQPAVRFHHLHYRVGDPAAAMNAAAAKLEGTRVVVPGLGVGVRAGREFVLYDRFDESDPPELLQRTVAHAYDAAVEWLKVKGLSAAPEKLSASRIAHAPAGPYHHIAFVAADYDDAVARIGAAPLKTTSESALFDAGGGLLVEIVRETDLPDAFWCPMHPDVRSGTAGKCPVCRKDLGPMPPPRIGEYRLDVTVQRGPRGAKGLRLAVREPDSNAVVQGFATVHEKLLHLFIVSRDLEYFAHVHPQQSRDGFFDLEHELPPGEYMLIADFLPAHATSQLVQRAIIVPPSRSASASAKASADRSAGKPQPHAVRAGLSRPDAGVRVSLKAEKLVAGREGTLTFTVTHATTGAPVTDLEPFLGAPAHVLIVRSDLGDALHEHPDEQVTGGPTISFHPLIPARGDYKLWFQIQRGGRVFTFPFLLRAEQ